jgi:hypothetical protein
VIVLEFKLMVEPTQTGELLFGTGAFGEVLIVTDVVPPALGQPATIAYTVYVPAARVVAPVIVGFCVVEVKLFGPVQL